MSTATSATSPLGICLDMDSNGRIKKRSSVARQVCLLFPLFRILASFSDGHDSHFDQPLYFASSTEERIRKKRQAGIWKGSCFAQRLRLRALHGRFWSSPNCEQSTREGVRLYLPHIFEVLTQQKQSHSSVQIKTMGIPSPRASVTALWGPKALDNVVDIDLKFEVEKDRATLRHLQRYIGQFLYICPRD